MAKTSTSSRKGSLDPAGRDKAVDRLKRIEGQVRGLQRMIEEQRYCPEVLIQIAAVQESLRAVGELLMQSHLRHCVTDAIRSRDVARAEQMYGEIAALFKRYAR